MALIPYTGSERKYPIVKIADPKSERRPPKPTYNPPPKPLFMNVAQRPHPMPDVLWKIMGEVCVKHNVHPMILISPERTKRLKAVRQEFVVRARTETSMSYPQIGRAMRKDHSSAVYLYQNWEYNKSKEPDRKLPRGILRKLARPLTAREIEYMQLEQSGMNYKQIAILWNVAESTARTIKSLAVRKLKMQAEQAAKERAPC